MATYLLITTEDRTLDVEAGGTIPQLSEGEKIAAVQRVKDSGEFTPEDRQWMLKNVVPLLKAAGAKIGWR